MARRILLVAALIVVGLILSGVARAQSDSAAQARRVTGRVLSSTSLPPIRIRFGKSFRYAGSQQFTLYERARAEQHFFVEADGRRRIRRMYMAQFEGYLPGVDASYNYSATSTVRIAGQDYIVNAEVVPSVRAALSQDPQSDAARAVSFLESKGYRLPEGVVFQRFVRLVDEAKRNEFILLYVEDLKGADKEKARREISDRALKGFEVLN